MAELLPVLQTTIDALIADVDKPARYTGGEVNSVVKTGPLKARMALAFPDVYEVAESHIGFKILYEIINDHQEFAAERVYAMWPDLEKKARTANVPLWSLESHLPLRAFDVVGFTLQYELCYPTVLAMLELGGIPIRAEKRAESDPIVIGGGICTYNAEPVAPFFDAFLLGDGERAVVEILQVVAQGRAAGLGRAAILKSLAAVQGVYVPGHFDVTYAGINVTAITAQADTPHAGQSSPSGVPQVTRAVVPDLDAVPFSTRPIVPNVQPVHERVAIEIQRGCSRSCRFCQPGLVTRPTRQRHPEKVVALADAGLAASGCDMVGLLSLSAGDYAPINNVVTTILNTHHKDRVSVSLPSLRSETLTDELAERLAASAAAGFTLAPEAGSERLRNVINKTSTKANLIQAVEAAVMRGWRNLKFYFMIGLPTETDEDVVAIIELAESARQAARRIRNDANITVSVSTFVPKPHTPFQWEGQMSVDETRRKHRYLREELKRRRITFRYHSPEQSFLEGILARGDRRLADAIEQVMQKGGRLDAWTEQYDHNRWLHAIQTALAQHGLTPEQFLENRPIDGLLAWDHLDAGILKKFLKTDRERAFAEKTINDCALTSTCYACGGCDLVHPSRTGQPDTVEPRVHAKEVGQSLVAPSGASRVPSGPPVARSRLRFRFAKQGRAVHLSQLDTFNQIVRAVRQSGLPVMYSEGHVPRPKVGFSPACPTGIVSHAEFFEADCRGFPDPATYVKKLNRWLPDGLQVQEGYEIPVETPSFNELIRSTTYAVQVPEPHIIAPRLAQFDAASSAWVKILRKEKHKVVDAKRCIVAAKEQGAELAITLGFSRFGTIKIGEAIAAILGLDAVATAVIRKASVELGTTPLTHDAPETVAVNGTVLDLTSVTERRTISEPGRDDRRMPYAE